MKVVVINGQNHKGSTWHIGRMLAEKLTVPEDITEFFLPRDMPHFCLGCTQCFMKSETLCPHAAQLAPITAAMDAADVLIFTSPVYVYHATGSMKAFLDHYGWRWMPHRPEAKMFTKQGVVISTAAGGGMKSTNRDIADSLFFWGVPRVYKYGLAVAQSRGRRSTKSAAPMPSAGPTAPPRRLGHAQAMCSRASEAARSLASCAF